MVFAVGSVLAGCYSIMSWPAAVGHDTSIGLMLWVMVIATTAACGWVIGRDGLSAKSITFYYACLFLGITPAIFYRTGRWLFGDISNEMPEEIRLAIAVCAVFLITLVVAERFANGWVVAKLAKGRVYGWFDRDIQSSRFVMGVVLQAIICAVLLAVLGKDAMLYRTGTIETAADKSVILLLSNFLRPLSFFIAAIILLHIWMSKAWYNLYWLIPSGVLAIAANFPISLARYYLLFICTVVFFILCFRWRWWPWLSNCFLSLGFMAGMIADQFRFLNRLSDVKDASGARGEDYLFAGHFDSFEMTVYGVQYVAEKGILWGNELLGVLFFWVPRLFWESKPVGTGGRLGSEFIGIMQATQNINLSAPLPLEGYINLGWFGVILLGGIFGVLCGLSDGTLAHARNFCRQRLPIPSGLVFWVYILIPSFVGMSLFILRGSLISAFAYSCGIAAAALCAFMLMTAPSRKNSSPALRSTR